MADIHGPDDTVVGSTDSYFAAKDCNDAASILLGKADTFFNVLRSNNYLDKLQNQWRFYYGAYLNDYVGNGHRVNFTGEQGELTQIPINHYRNLAQHIYTMITSSRPTMDARAINTDYKSYAQTILANQILDYYMREKKLEDCIKSATEMAIVMGQGYVKLAWNATAGEIYDVDPETNQPIRDGELEYCTLSPLDVVVDGTKESWNNDWILTRQWINKYDLMAKYPEFAEKIRGMKPKNQSSVYRIAVWSNDDTDDIAIYEFFHKVTESMPNGRYMLFCDAECVFLDAKMPYREIPVYRITPNDILGTPYGYSPMFDIYPIQEGINALYSTIMTNQNTFGVQNIWMPEDADIQVASLKGGMNVIKSKAKPEALNLTQTPAEVFKFLDMLIQASETISGVNSVARGNPEASLKSGTALALVQSQALQFISGLQANYVKLIEEVGTGTIQILKDFANTPKMITLVGKNNRNLTKEFTGEKISAVNRVVVDMGNPLARCLAKDTPVLMYDGSIKLVQDVKINDLVMGPDSIPRTVSNVNSGQEMMYEVESKDPNRKIKYGCNESHILTLKYCSDDYRYDVKKGDILDITVRDYLKLPDRHKRLLQGFKTGVEFDKKKFEVPAYILGAWLGDGTSRTTALTTMDNELADAWINYGHSLGLEVRVEENRQPNKSKNYHITSGKSHGPSDRNSFMNELRSMELINNKHIPSCYLLSSRKDRLDLLAGLIDTDGYRIDETYVFTQKNDRLSQEVVFLSESLGFRTTSKKVSTSSSKLTGPITGEVNKITIGGNTWEIPCKLPRKQVQKKEKSRDWLNYGIKVTLVGEGTYYGFTLVEEPHFVLGDFTVTHNTIAGRVQMAEQMMQMKIIKNPQQYFQVINTGRIEAMYEGETDDLMLIKKENEQLLDGINPVVSPMDKHSVHIDEHSAVLADPDLRNDPAFISNVMDHIEAHLNALRQTDPALLQMRGEQPLPPLQPNNPNPPGGQPNPPPPQNPPQASLQGAPAAPMLQPGAGAPKGVNQMTGPGIKNEGLPKPAVVKAGLLANPALQQSQMGNVKP